jgi:hypothetical protein
LRKPKPTKVCSATGRRTRRRRNSSSTPPTINGLLGHDAQFLTFNNVAGTNIVSLKQRSRKINNKIIMPFHLLLKN